MKALLLLTKTNGGGALFLARLTLGLVMFPHGAQKALGWFGGYGFSGTMNFFTGTMHIPALFAFLAILAEFAEDSARIDRGLVRVMEGAHSGPDQLDDIIEGLHAYSA